MRRSVVVLIFLAWIGRVAGEFNQCLGIEMYRLRTSAECGRLYDACQAGVAALNMQLKTHHHNYYHPVSLVSATESKAKSATDSMLAMLVQLAPVTYCAHSSAAPHNSSLSEEQCTFDMKKIEIYSILLRQEDPTSQWTLDGYKHHALSEGDRAQIVAQYKSGHFFGTNLAIGIFDTPNLPAQVVSDSIDKTIPRSPVAVFAVIASVTITIGLFFHHRRRLHNGYAPIVVTKRAHFQGRSLRRPTSAEANLGVKDPSVVSYEGTTLTQERFAV